MSDTFILSGEGIITLQSSFVNDEHFSTIALPRIRLICAIKDELAEFDKLIWRVKYSPSNRFENCVIISLEDELKKFHFYYVIPLSIGLKAHLYLGDNTFNFFEAYPLLIQQGIITKEEYSVEVTANTLPHLVLNTAKDKYERQLLLKDTWAPEELCQSKLYRVLSNAFKRFNKPLFDIINGTYKL